MKSNLICPHCGGPFQIDDQMALQPDWHCPYCSRVSHFKIKQGQLSLATVLHESGEMSENSDSPPLTTSHPEDSKVAETDAIIDNHDIKSAESATSQHVDQLADQAFSAFKSLNMPLFNVLARQLLDINPEDKRVYAWRAVLREYAQGFARCWADPIWLERTKSQRQVMLKQHFYDLTMALRMQSEDEQKALIGEISQLIADQIIKIFREVTIARRARKFRRSFKGRHTKKDLFLGQALNLTWQEWMDAIPEVEEAELPDACKLAVQQKDSALYQALLKYKYF